MRTLLLGLGFGLCAAAPAAAYQFERCEKAQIAYVTEAADTAARIASRAAANIGPNPTYERWFGPYRPDRAETVRANLKAIDSALDNPGMTFICPNVGEDGCDLGTYANVWPDDALRVNLCHAFFNMPRMEGIVATSGAFETGTREGTLIHEVSHFVSVAGTDDHWYTRTTCSENAQDSPQLAIANADSYQYFVEDVVFDGIGIEVPATAGPDTMADVVPAD